MSAALDELAKISVPVRTAPVDFARVAEAIGPDVVDFLRPLLSRRNGLYAFKQALHVYSDLGNAEEPGLIVWNSDGLWKHEYGELARGAVFFAEDIFGVQFCVLDGVIATFDPETGETETVARDLAGWAKSILADYEFLTGYQLGHAWQSRHGALKPGTRLVPKQPFVLGGAFDVENLNALDAASGMAARGHIAVQLAGLPDGAQVKITITD